MHMGGHDYNSMKLYSLAVLQQAVFQSKRPCCWRKKQLTFGSESDKISPSQVLDVRQVSSVEVLHRGTQNQSPHEIHLAPALLPVLASLRRTLAQARVPVPHNHGCITA